MVENELLVAASFGQKVGGEDFSRFSGRVPGIFTRDDISYKASAYAKQESYQEKRSHASSQTQLGPGSRGVRAKSDPSLCPPPRTSTENSAKTLVAGRPNTGTKGAWGRQSEKIAGRSGSTEFPGAKDPDNFYRLRMPDAPENTSKDR
ncbi:hypothetical protein FQN53_005497, partial [Emmonsiellopsis sp. PD_33]